MEKLENVEKNFISAVVYINSAQTAQNLDEFLKKINNILQKKFSFYEIICIDDASAEEYIETVQQFKKINSNLQITIIHMSFYQGLEASMNAGRELAIGDFVYEFDTCNADFPEDIMMNAYRNALQDCDIVCCCDRKKHKKSSSLFYSIFNRFSGMDYKLLSDNFRIISRRAINRIESLNKVIPYRKALYANCGLKMDYIFYDSTLSEKNSFSKKQKKDRLRTGIDAMILFTDIGYHIAVILTGMMAFVMIIAVVYALSMYFRGIAIVGWTTTILFLSFAFFALFMIMAIVIKYLSLVLNLIFKRQKYVFEKIEKL